MKELFERIIEILMVVSNQIFKGDVIVRRESASESLLENACLSKTLCLYNGGLEIHFHHIVFRYVIISNKESNEIIYVTFKKREAFRWFMTLVIRTTFFKVRGDLKWLERFENRNPELCNVLRESRRDQALREINKVA